MENKYLNKITTLLKQARPKLFTTHKLEFKNVFGAVAKERLLKEGGNETVTKCHGLKMVAADGK